MAARGCGGSRVAGGIYAIGATSPNGVPFRDLLFCPPQRVTREELTSLGITARGVHLLPRPTGAGTGHDLVDVIGMEHYPTPAHWIVESERLGISRRLPSTLDFSKLSPDVRLFAVHYHGWVEDPKQLAYFWNDRQEYTLRKRQPYCPKQRPGHDRRQAEAVNPMCCGLYWEDLTGVPYREAFLPDFPDMGMNIEHFGERAVYVTAPGGDFSGLSRPGRLEDGQEELPKIAYEPAIFGAWPIGRIEVVRDPEGDKHVKAMEAATWATGIPVELVEE